MDSKTHRLPLTHSAENKTSQEDRWRVLAAVFVALLAVSGCGIDTSGFTASGTAADVGRDDAGRDTGLTDTDLVDTRIEDTSSDVIADTPVDVECQGSETQPCAGNSDGICDPGVRRCIGGVFGACEDVVTPGVESCDGTLDEDCDGTVDEGCACSGNSTQVCTVRGCAGEQKCNEGSFGPCDDVNMSSAVGYYPDADGDGFGALGSAMELYCVNPGAGWARVATDCEDGNPAVNPGASDTCTQDRDCTAGLSPPITRSVPSYAAYIYCTEQVNFDGAVAVCAGLDGDYSVVEIGSAAENGLVTEMTSEGIWLNIRRDSSGTLRWLSDDRRVLGHSGHGGTAGSWPWLWGEPNNFLGREDCVEMYHDGPWNDFPCDGTSLERRHTVCESPL